MKNIKRYIEHSEKAVEADGKFEHVMAIALDPRFSYKEGVIRCIASREGDVATAGYIDRSVLHKVRGETLEKFSLGEKLTIKNQDEIVVQLGRYHADFLGLEDPDIWIDEVTGLMHLYFTMPFVKKVKHTTLIHLGHAVGRDLNSLEMTMPVLIDKGVGGAKEVSIAPVNKQGFRYNLVESSAPGDGFAYSTVCTTIAGEMGEPWQLAETVFHPKLWGIPWIAGHASPGPLFPKDFIDVGKGKLLGVVNGREANKKYGESIAYGTFSVGLFVYDYESGVIDWVSPEPFIEDSAARTITFASQFVPTKKGEGILYAHVDDFFVRAYTLNAKAMKSLLP